jgi:hypothetical protein
MPHPQHAMPLSDVVAHVTARASWHPPFFAASLSDRLWESSKLAIFFSTPLLQNKVEHPSYDLGSLG